MPEKLEMENGNRKWKWKLKTEMETASFCYSLIFFYDFMAYYNITAIIEELL